MIYSLSDSEFSAYYLLIKSRLGAAGLIADNYFDFDSVETAYNISCNVTVQNPENTDEYNLGTFRVIVVETDGQYSILYDDVFIQGLLDSLSF